MADSWLVLPEWQFPESSFLIGSFLAHEELLPFCYLSRYLPSPVKSDWDQYGTYLLILGSEVARPTRTRPTLCLFRALFPTADTASC